MMDGGICSQIWQYFLGKYLADKGYEVEYDILWFKNHGKDMNHVHARNF